MNSVTTVPDRTAILVYKVIRTACLILARSCRQTEGANGVYRVSSSQEERLGDLDRVRQIWKRKINATTRRMR